MSDETFWYFKTSRETWGHLPANRIMVGLYSDFQMEYQIWKVPSTTTLEFGLMSNLYPTYEEAKEGPVYLGQARVKPGT